MTATTLPVDGANFSASLGYANIPHRDLFVEDYLFRGSSASLVNRLNPGAAPAVPLGSPTFDAVSAVCTGIGAGIQTAASTSSYDRTTFLVFQHVYDIPQTGENPPPIPKPGEAKARQVLSWNNGNQYAGFAGTNFTFRPSNGSDDIATSLGNGDGNGNGYAIKPDVPFYYPDGTVDRPKRWVILVTMSNGTQALFSLEHEVPMQTYGPVNRVVMNVTPSVTRVFGAGQSATETGRAARLMIAKAMTLPQIMRVVAYLRLSMRELGVEC